MPFDPDEWPPQRYWKDVTSDVADYLAGGGRMSLPDGGGPIGELEDVYRSWTGRSFAVTYNSGTSALLAGYFGIGIQAGDDVLVSAYNYHAAATALIGLGARPVLCDIDPLCGDIDLADAAARMTTRTSAIVVTHMYGHIGEMSGVEHFARSHGLQVVEDASHAHGAVRDGRAAGGYGNVSVFSLQENKLAPAGEGGIVVTDDPSVYERAMVFGHVNGRLRKLTDPALRALVETGLGRKLRMHPLAAVAGLVGQRLCEVEVPRRQRAALHFASLFDGSVIQVPQDAGSAYYLLRAKIVDDMPIGALDEALIEAKQLGFPLRRASLTPMYRLPLFAAGSPLIDGAPWQIWDSKDFPGTERYTSRLLSLPTMVGRSRREDRERYAEAAVQLLARGRHGR